MYNGSVPPCASIYAVSDEIIGSSVYGSYPTDRNGSIINAEATVPPMTLQSMHETCEIAPPVN